MIKFLLALPFLFLTACFIGRSSKNEPISPTAIAQLVPGTTTALQVVESFGAPVDIVQLGRRSAYLFHHSVERNTGFLVIVVGLYNEDIRSDRLWVFFDEQGVLTHYGATLAADRARRAMPWTKIHKKDEAPKPKDADKEDAASTTPDK